MGRSAESRHASASLRVPGYGKVPSLRDDADVAMVFLQPHFGGFCDAPRRWRMPMEDGFLRCTARWRMPMDGGFLRCTASLAHTKGEWFFQWGMSMVGRRFLCRIILVGIVLKLWLSVIFSMIYLSIKCFYGKMLEKLVFCY